MKKLFYFLFLFFFVFIISLDVARAEEPCDPSTVNVSLRNESGDFIPNLNFEIYVQENDVDGNPKPSTFLKAGKIDPNLGRGTVKFVSKAGKFALRAYDQNKTTGSFWFYDDINVGCGGEVDVEETLSSLTISLRDTELNLLKNKEVSIYTQRYDADNNPIKEKVDLVGKLNTSEEGVATIYVPDTFRSIDGKNTSYYVVEHLGINGGMYSDYDNRIFDGRNTKLEYVLSDMKLYIIKDDGNPYPSGQKVSLYQQKKDSQDNDILGEKIKDFTTNALGEVVIQYPYGVYAAQILGANNQTINYWNLEIQDEKRIEYELGIDGDWQTSQGACKEKSNLSISALTMSGEPLGGLKYEVYEQQFNAGGIPAAGSLVVSGIVDANGKANSSIAPNPTKKYAIKFYSANKTVGDYWFFNEIGFLCGKNYNLIKKFPALNIVLRNTNNELIKNKKISLYTQKLDVDGNPVKEKKDLVGSAFITGEEGRMRAYLSPDHAYDKNKRGIYVMEVVGENSKTYYEYDIKMSEDIDTNLEYVFSDLMLSVLEGNDKPAANLSVSIYSESKDASGNYSLGQLQLTQTTDASGRVRFALPSGFYSVSIKDNFKKDMIFYHVRIYDKRQSKKSIKMNLTKISVLNSKNQLKPNSAIKIFALKENESGKYYRGALIGSSKTSANGFIEMRLTPGPYLFVYTENKNEYGKTIFIEKNKFQDVRVTVIAGSIVRATDEYALAKPPRELTMGEKQSGKILLQVEMNGEAWYVDTVSKKRYYMRDGATAYAMMRKFGLGIKNSDLSKIPIGLDDRFDEADYDGDGVPDKTEEAIGTDMRNHDSDGDTYEDGQEIKNGFNPRGPGAAAFDQKTIDRLKGKIVLQVESKGEAWYIHPSNGKRYYMKDGESAYEIMRFLSLGVSNESLDEIEEGMMK